MATNSMYPTFCLPGDPASITLYQSDADTPDKLIASVFKDNGLFQEYISTTPLPRLRIISIHSKSSIKPLQISEDALWGLKNTYNIGDELWDLTSTFGDKPMSAAVGEGAMKAQSGENGIQDISYRLTFPTPVGASDWTMRQMGVFHHHDPNELQNLWIFFHVGPDTPMQKEIEQYASISQQGLRSDHAWLTLHSSVFSSCLNNWRSYVKYLGHDVDRHTDRSLDFVLRNIDHFLTAGGDSNLTAIHNTRDLILPTSYRLRVILDTLTKMGHLSSVLASQHNGANNGFQRLVTYMEYHKDRIEGLVIGVDVLKKKIKDILNMTTLGLDFRMSSQMLDLNNRMVELNNRMLNANEQLLQIGTKSFDDNATVKVVTILTLIYLPASLVSSFFGMNLFKFDDGTTEELRISRQFWIFVVATIILAVITISTWYLWTHKEQVRRRKFGLLRRGPAQDTEKLPGQN
ncbi:hypothetical protein N7517_004070 [Penicillium concentricum]|uniref:CorA-like transporter domain-containing protein n=1 Tax=Penicillium concentricum TaxID=293559 RepID=A0A9W9S7H2_9EURO|nr:uncharacterized protein N7517_004070 [Penicillium concentricum]KAJ5372064.1 hypothetical protein N7517_004070 [Penicillium concentricum]